MTSQKSTVRSVDLDDLNELCFYDTIQSLDQHYKGFLKMPVISMFYGIIIRMNFTDHNPPHFHAEYQGFQAAFDIKNGKMLAGEFPPNARKLVESWTKKNKKALLINWKNAVSNEPLERIPGME